MLRMATDFIWWHFQWSMSQNFIRETKQQRCIFLGFVFKIIPLSLYLLFTLKAFLEAAEMASTSLSAHKALLRWWMWVGGDPGNASGVWKWDTHLVYEPKDSRVNSSQGLFHLGSMVGVPGRSLGPAPYPGLRSLNCGQNPQAECVSVVCTYYILFIHSSVDRQLGFPPFWLLWIMVRWTLSLPWNSSFHCPLISPVFLLLPDFSSSHFLTKY